MSAILHTIGRRGVEVHAQASEYYQQLDDADKLPVWGVVVMALTGFLYLFASIAIEYTFGRVIPTLIMVESPQAVLFEPIKSDDPDAALDSKVEQELLLVKQEPITSSFRRTVKHLKANAGGFRGKYRGMGIFIIHNVAVGWISGWLSALPFLSRDVTPLIATVITANLSLAWTHIVIGEFSTKPWYRRVPSLKVWKKVAGPTAILAIVEQLAVYLPTALMIIFVSGIDKQAARTHAEASLLTIKAVGILILGIGLALGLVLPANVALTRVQASLLPDELDTIVPFDRSFDGKVVPEILGGTGVVSILEAWKTFEVSARIRLIKAYFKVFAMQLALVAFFTFVAIAEVVVMVGCENLKKIADGKKAAPEFHI